MNTQLQSSVGRATLVRHIATYGLGRMLPGLASTVYLAFLAHIFGPREYALYALSLGLAVLLSGVVGGGLGYAILRIYPSTPVEASQRIVLGVLVLWLVLSVAIGASTLIAGLVLLSVWPSIYKDAAGFVIAAVFLFLPLSGMTILGEVLRAQLRPLMFVALQAIYSVGSLAIGLPIIVLAHATIVAAIWSATVASLIGIIVVLGLLGLHRALAAGARPGGIRELMAFAWPIGLGGVSIWSFRLSDRYVLSAFVKATDVGIYTSVFDLAERLVSAVREPILLTIQPMAIHEAVGHDTRANALRDGAAAYIAVSGFLALLTILIAPTIVKVFLGPSFSSGASLLGILAVAAVLTGFVNLGVLMLTIMMRPRLVAASQSGAAVAKLAINLLAIPVGGIWAAATTTVAMNLVLAGILWAASGERAQALLRDALLRRMVLCLVGSIVFALTAQMRMGIPEGATRWAVVIGALLAYTAAMSWALGFSRVRGVALQIVQQRSIRFRVRRPQ